MRTLIVALWVMSLDRPFTRNPQTGGALAFIYDPWGTYIELNERPNPL